MGSTVFTQIQNEVSCLHLMCVCGGETPHLGFKYKVAGGGVQEAVVGKPVATSSLFQP